MNRHVSCSENNSESFSRFFQSIKKNYQNFFGNKMVFNLSNLSRSRLWSSKFQSPLICCRFDSICVQFQPTKVKITKTTLFTTKIYFPEPNGTKKKKTRAARSERRLRVEEKDERKTTKYIIICVRCVSMRNAAYGLSVTALRTVKIPNKNSSNRPTSCHSTRANTYSHTHTATLWMHVTKNDDD